LSEVRRGHALWTLRWRIALATLALGVLAYPIAWNADPWVFGIVVLGLGPVQGAVGCLGMLARLTRLDQHIGGPMAWIVEHPPRRDGRRHVRLRAHHLVDLRRLRRTI
jgi:hypothetical protein